MTDFIRLLQLLVYLENKDGGQYLLQADFFMAVTAIWHNKISTQKIEDNILYWTNNRSCRTCSQKIYIVKQLEAILIHVTV